ncbi:MAG: formyltransferase family protein [Pirellulales bacterium]
MQPKRILVLAGHQRSLASIALVAALARLPRDVASLAGVISTSPFSIRKICHWRRRFGHQFVKKILSQFGLARTGQFADETTVYSHWLKEMGIGRRSLRTLCSDFEIPLHVVRNINDARSVHLIDRLHSNLAVYSGAGILRKAVIDAIAGGIVNLHCGPLPHVRGMNAVEWSLYLGIQPEVTLHKIDTGIDTGPVLASQTVAVQPGEPLGTIRARTALAGIDLLLRQLAEVGAQPPIHNPKFQGRQYYTMAEPVKQLVQSWLDQGVTPVSSSDQIEPDDTRPAILRRKAA